MARAYRQRPTTRFRPWAGPAGGFPLFTLPQVSRCSAMATATGSGLRRALGRGQDLREGSSGDGKGLPAAAYNALWAVGRTCGRVPPAMATAYRHRPTTRFRPWEGPAGGFPLHPPAGPKVPGDGNGYRHWPTTRFRPWEGPAGGFPLFALPQIPRCPAMAAAYRQRPTTRFRPPRHHPPAGPKVPGDGNGYRHWPTTRFGPWAGPAGGFLWRWQRLTGSGLRRALGRGQDLREGSPSSPSRRSQGARRSTAYRHRPTTRFRPPRHHPPAGPKVPGDGNGLSAAAYDML